MKKRNWIVVPIGTLSGAAFVSLSVLSMSWASSAEADTAAQARIRAAFTELGMPPDQAACYGRTLDDELDAETAERAAQIIEQAEDSADLRERVPDGGVDMVTAFLSAEAACGQ